MLIFVLGFISAIVSLVAWVYVCNKIDNYIEDREERHGDR